MAQKAGNGTIGVKILKLSQAPIPLDHPSTNTFRVLAHPIFSSLKAMAWSGKLG